MTTAVVAESNFPIRQESTMSKPVYMLVVGKDHTEAWYQLSKEEQDNLWSKVEEVDKRAGAKG